MTRIYRPDLDFIVLDDRDGVLDDRDGVLDDWAGGDAIDADALRDLQFEAPDPLNPGTTLRYNGLTRPPLGDDGEPDNRLQSLQVRVLTGELCPRDIKIARDVINGGGDGTAFHPAVSLMSHLH